MRAKRLLASFILGLGLTLALYLSLSAERNARAALAPADVPQRPAAQELVSRKTRALSP
jgi:hypothetical protein